MITGSSFALLNVWISLIGSDKRTMRVPTVKVYVKNVSMESLEAAGVEFGVSDNEYEKSEHQMHKEYIYSLLTKKQRNVLQLLAEDGMSRKEAAKHLQVHIQAIHQIVLRIRRRLNQKGYKRLT